MPIITVARVILQNGPRIFSNQIRSPLRSETTPSLATRSPSRSPPARRRCPNRETVQFVVLLVQVQVLKACY